LIRPIFKFFSLLHSSEAKIVLLNKKREKKIIFDAINKE